MALIVLVLLHYVERRFLLPQASSEHQLQIETTSLADNFIDHMYEACARSGVTVEGLGVRAEQGIDTIKIVCHIPNPAAMGHLVSDLQSLPGVRVVYADIHRTDTENMSMKSRMHKES